MRNRLKGLSAHGIALVALFVALGTGGAYAATTLLPANSVGSKQIRNGSVNIRKLTAWEVQQLTKVADGAERGKNGTNGTNGQNGQNGAPGTPGAAGSTGPAGPQGPSGVNNPFVFTYTGATGPDSGTCGNDWATDTYDATYTVTPGADGSFTVVKFVQGSFVTIAGDSPGSCAASTDDQVTGGRAGTFYGTESWKVASPGDEAADFHPTATCGAACSPNTAGTSSSASEAQNKAFESAFFPSSNYQSDINAGENFDFVYTAGGQSWTDSNTPDNNQGDITG